MFVEFLVLLILAAFVLYKWANSTYNFFKLRKVPFDKPFPLFGALKNVVFRKRSLFDNVIDIYNKFDCKFFGLFEMRTPVFVIKDPEIIREVTTKYFDHFVNHRSVFKDTDGGLFGNMLLTLTDQKWKDMRNTLSPAFTGSKLRLMYQLIQEVSKQSIVHLKKERAAGNELDVDIKDLFTRFSNDVIATAAFGIEVDSLAERDNEFYTMGKTATTFTAWQNMKFVIFQNFKGLAKLFRLSLFSKKFTDYFTNLVIGAMKYRAERGIVRPDIINILMEATAKSKADDAPNDEKKPSREWTDAEIVAQCLVFFFAGFETVSVLICFAAHELMENGDVQTKLVEEIDEVRDSLNGAPLSYEVLLKMKYLDAVISEALRKWPPAPFVDRQCNQSFKMEDVDNDLSVDVQVGDVLWLPIAGIHRDPKFYDRPEVFDPERFSEENKDKIQPFTYLPFGMGPRNCIGTRFALLEAKAMLFYLLSEFSLKPSEKTTIPLELDVTSLQLTAKNGFWLKLVPRN